MLMCIFCTFNAVFANVSADKTVTIKSENISVKEALNMVKKQTGINIMYEDATLNNVPLKLTLNKEPLEQALSVICSQAGIRYEGCLPPSFSNSSMTSSLSSGMVNCGTAYTVRTSLFPSVTSTSL